MLGYMQQVDGLPLSWKIPMENLTIETVRWPALLFNKELVLQPTGAQRNQHTLVTNGETSV